MTMAFKTNIVLVFRIERRWYTFKLKERSTPNIIICGFVSYRHKMWFACQSDNSLYKSQFIKVNHYMSKYGLQHGALAHTD